MHLIAPLAAGLRGAENGTVEIYRRGTSTFAPYYEAFEATDAITPPGALPLDANGSIVLYVDGIVEVRAYDANGVLTRSFTDAPTSSSVEVISDSFTGTDYESGFSAVSEPTTLQAVLDAWNNSAGAPDWKVLLGGQIRTIQDLAIAQNLYFNVKDPRFGAKGDFSTDDSGAIQAALTAASAAGRGVVFFPPGDYRCNASLTVLAGVSMLGCGSQCSRIFLNHATSGFLDVTAGTLSGFQSFIEGLRIDTLSINTGSVLTISGRALVQQCYLGSTFNTGAPVVNVGSGVVTFFANTIESSVCHVQSFGTGIPRLIANEFIFPNGAYGNTSIVANAGGCWIIGNDFKTGTVGSGVGGIGSVASSAANPSIVAFNICRNPSGPMSPIAFTGVATSWEIGNVYGSNISDTFSPIIVSATNVASRYGGVSLQREYRRGYVTDDTTPIVIPARNIGHYEVRRTTAAAQTWSVEPPPYTGARLTLTLNNDQAGGAINITFAGVKGLVLGAASANRVTVWHCQAVENVAAGGGVGTIYWRLVGSTANDTP